MDRAELFEHIKLSADQLVRMFETKNRAYGHDGDAFYNFRETARRLHGNGPTIAEAFDVLLTLADKHWVALMQQGAETSEASERLLDMAVYALIGRAMLSERKR